MLMRCFIVFLLITTATEGFCQEIDLSGRWNGISSFGKARYQNELRLAQEGSIVTGRIETYTLDKSSFIKAEMNGIYEEGQLVLKGTRIIDKKGLFSCMSTLELTYTEDEQETLEGKWKPLRAKGGCLVGSGPIKLAKLSNELVADNDRGFKSNVRDGPEPSTLIEALTAGSYYALIIGIEDYDDEGIPDLDFPIDDATSLYQVLVDQYAFDAENISLLNSPSRSEILEAFDDLSQKTNPSDNVLIFYAGHGLWEEKIEQGFWLPKDASPNSRAQWISNGTIRDYIRSIDSRHTLLIADACFSGGILKQRSIEAMPTEALSELYKNKSRKALTSGTLKTVPDKSVFMKYLVKELKENEIEVVSADQLFAGFKAAVINNSPNHQIPQYGVIHQANDEGGDFLFLKKQD